MNLDLICFYQMFLHLHFLHGTMRTLENFANQGNGVTQGHPVSQAGLKPQDRRLSVSWSNHYVPLPSQLLRAPPPLADG